MRIEFLGVSLAVLVACDSSQTAPTQSPEPQSQATVAAPAEQAEPLVSVPGTAIRLIPPPGFAAMSSYDGFRNEQTGGVIMVMRIDRPYADVRAAMEANLAADGVTPDYAEDLAQGELPGRLVLVSQARGGEVTSSWQRLLGSGEETIVISGICSQAPCDEQLEQLEAALRSAVWDSDAPQQLGLHLVDTGGLQAIMENERELMYSTDGTLAGDVVFHVSLVPGSISDEQRQRALDRFEALHGFVAQDVKPVTIDGLEGRASVGASKGSANGKLFYDVVLFDREGIWYLTGNARKDSPATREVFERMANSFARGSAARFSGG